MDRYQITKIREVKTTTTGKEYTILDLVLDGSSSHYENVRFGEDTRSMQTLKKAGLSLERSSQTLNKGTA